ncbi:putative hydrolase [Sesbania bispinosa]|nr:putative hydrolase [Sesbania bispinosa]
MSPVGGGEEATSQLQAPSEEEKEVPSEDDPTPTSPTKNLEERDTYMIEAKSISVEDAGIDSVEGMAANTLAMLATSYLDSSS